MPYQFVFCWLLGCVYQYIYLTVIPYHSPLQVCLTSIPNYQYALPVRLTSVSYKYTLQVYLITSCLSSMPCQYALPIYLTNMPDQYALPVCFTNMQWRSYRSCYANLQLSRTTKTIVNLHSMTRCYA